MHTLVLPNAQNDAVTDRVQKLLTILETYPVSSRQERVLRLIASKYYAKGYCFARHDTLAKAIGCAKSTLQLEIDELEVRGLLKITRRTGTSNITILSEGLIEALRLQCLSRKRKAFIDRFGIESIVSSVQACEETARRTVTEISVHAESVVQSFFEKATETSKSLITIFNRPKAAKQPITVVSLPKELHNRTSSRPLNGDEQKIKETMIAEGISQTQATRLIHTFGTERVTRNIKLGLHKTAANPGGYLATAIRDDFAATAIRPDSEAAIERAKEKAKVVPSSSEVKVPVAAPIPESNLERITKAFEKLDDCEKSNFERQAEESFRLAPPAWLICLIDRHGFEHPPVRAAIRSKAIALWRQTVCN